MSRSSTSSIPNTTWITSSAPTSSRARGQPCRAPPGRVRQLRDGVSATGSFACAAEALQDTQAVRTCSLPARTTSAIPTRDRSSLPGTSLSGWRRHLQTRFTPPGHTPVRIAVHCPRIGCCSPATPFFPECQTWLIASDVNQWITALDRIRTRRRPRGLRSWGAGD